MKKSIPVVWTYVTVLLFIPIYHVLDAKLLVDIFGCGCVPLVHANKLNIAFNANDLKAVVFALFTVGMTVWSIFLSKRFQPKNRRILYCVSVFLCNAVLGGFYAIAFRWK